ncbi:hypothetical protein ACODT5_02980 [Streptomyces sp. 5.8]|uniref:hypothetical protein n=1 Tax=Streptomyces sp. 5.8 TaxID=3406571 RepID=UPI003BB56A08
MRSTRGLAAVISVAIATLSAGCAGSTSEAGPGQEAARPAAAPSTATSPLPEGITALGSPAPIATQGWTLQVDPFQETSAGASAEGVPAGWTVLRTKARFTNSSGRVARLPDTALTVRFGPIGRQAVLVKDAVLTGLPAREAAVKETPGSTFTAEVGVAVPPQGLGQRVTVTAEATEEGMAEADNLFFEGTLPGTTAGASDSPVPTEAGPATEGVLPLDTWSQTGVRLSAITLGPAKDGVRSASADLTVVNGASQPRTGLGVTLRVLTGTDLRTTAALTAGLDYPDAPIAPSRPATVNVHFTLPSSAVPGPISVEAVDQGTTFTFSGTVS